MQKDTGTFAVFDAGLSVNPAIPYLGANPDGKVYDPAVANIAKIAKLLNCGKEGNLNNSDHDFLQYYT